LAIIASLGLPRHTALEPLQLLFMLDERTRIFDLFALAGGGQCFDADIYADFGFGFLERFDVSFNEDADEIALARIPAHRQIEDFGVVGKRPAPGNIQRPGLFGQRDLTVFDREGVGGVARRLAAPAGFEIGIFGPLLEEIRKSRVEIAERLLKRNRTDFGKKGPLGLLFPFGKFGGSFVIAHGFLFLLPGLSPKLERLIVNIASAPKGLRQLRRLFIGREESVFECLLRYHRTMLRPISAPCKHYLSKAKRPRCQIHLHPSLRLWMEMNLADLDNEDQSFQLLGLAWANADKLSLQKMARSLLALQNKDGGWGQHSTLESDAYATGQALVALHQAGGLPVTHRAYQRGVNYLLANQAADGSWMVVTRSFPFQKYFESGFPYGHNQWISATASS
jgi:hypothetical protein